MAKRPFCSSAPEVRPGLALTNKPAAGSASSPCVLRGTGSEKGV